MTHFWYTSYYIEQKIGVADVNLQLASILNEKGVFNPAG